MPSARDYQLNIDLSIEDKLRKLGDPDNKVSAEECQNICNEALAALLALAGMVHYERREVVKAKRQADEARLATRYSDGVLDLIRNLVSPDNN